MLRGECGQLSGSSRGTLANRSSHRATTELCARGDGQVWAAFRYTWADPRLFGRLLVVAAVATFVWNYGVLMPVLATSTFGGDTALYVLLLSTIGVGSFLGGF